MPAVERKMEEAELLDRMRLVAEAFRPAAPIDRRSMFSGRSEQISDIFSVIAQPGQHAVVYGERGVGKTSLATVAGELLRSANVLTARAICDVSDDFSSVWRKALGEIEFRTAKAAIGFSDRVTESAETAAQLLGAGPVTPDAVRTVLQRVAQQREAAIFIDEFDRLQDPSARVLFADTIKVLSDRLVRATVILIGVADSVGELIREHRSVERALVQIHMPRMSQADLADISNRGIDAARMTIGKEPVRKITTLSQGLPHYTQLLTQLAAQSALGRRRADVTGRDVDAAVDRAIDRAQESIVEAYRDATSSGRRSTHADVLLACALAPEDDFGFFSASDVREPLSRILGKPCTTSTFSKRLEDLTDDSRGAVLQRQGGPRAARYRFVNPLLQPYVAMRGVAEGVVQVKDLH